MKRLLDNSPGNDEVKRFHDAFRPLLAESMGLYTDKAMTDDEYYGKARGLKEKIRSMVCAEARDHGGQGYQNIWREKWDFLFAWVEDRRISNATTTRRNALSGRPSSPGRTDGKPGGKGGEEQGNHNQRVHDRQNQGEKIHINGL